MELTDIEILDEIQKGNKEKYALIMRRYNQHLYRIGKGYFRDEAEIEDVMQEAYIKAFQSIEKFERHALFGTWLTKILINECLQRLKKLKMATQLDENTEDSEVMDYTDNVDPENRTINNELRVYLEHNIEQLPEKYRLVFIMREIEKMSIEETANLLDLSLTNVKVRLNRSKEMLRKSLLKTYQMEDVMQFNLVKCERIATFVLGHI